MSCNSNDSNDLSVLMAFVPMSFILFVLVGVIVGFANVLFVCTIVPVALFFLWLVWRLLGAVIVGIRDGIVSTWDFVFSPKVPSPMTIEQRQEVYRRGLTQ